MSYFISMLSTTGGKLKVSPKEIIKNSKVRLFLVKDLNQLAKFIKNNCYGKKIIIGMGAGSISNWMRKLPDLM